MKRGCLPTPRWLAAICVGFSLIASAATAADEPFRPETGEFPPLEKAHSYRGELVFVDHANRRGSIRIQGEGKFRFTGPSPFAMLPYGIVRYHGSPADLRDIPLGTMLHVRAFLPPDPKISAVPVLPVDNRTKKLGNAGTGTAPAENHVLLLEDEPSYCQRAGKVWKLTEVDVRNNQGVIVASREPKACADGKAHDETMTFDAATRIWRGREYLGVEDLIAEGIWPASGKNSLDGQTVLLGITWKPTPGGVFTRFHISDIWLDDAAMQRAARNQTDSDSAWTTPCTIRKWAADCRSTARRLPTRYGKPDTPPESPASGTSVTCALTLISSAISAMGKDWPHCRADRRRAVACQPFAR